jgi:DsbC/DsbD-like thiol-disulfide interchange protein
MITTALFLLTAVDAWGPPAVVTHDDQPCVTYRAQLAGGLLAVEVKLEPGWHTFAMDNDKRAAAKLAGKKALSIDKPTQLQPEGVDVAGPWRQSAPKDFSQPDLRIFSWGFEGEARFVVPVKTVSGPVRVHIKGQACTQAVCKNVDVVADAAAGGAQPSTAGLIAVQ